MKTNWYKPICNKCPYFLDTENIEPRCERPTDSDCLAENIVVIQFETLQHITQEVIKRAMQAKRYPPIKHRKIKRMHKGN